MVLKSKVKKSRIISRKMKQVLRAIGIVQKKEINSKSVFEALTAIHQSDYKRIKHINFIHIDIVNAHLFNYQAEISNISKVNMHYKITFIIDDKYYHKLKSGMECMITLSYNDQYKTEVKKEIIYNNRLIELRHKTKE